ncbi:MAG: hypothetical protein ACREFV_12710, partial [Acetobacteraceae bacterium]
RIAAGSGIRVVRAVNTEADIADGARALREHNAASFVLLRVKDGPPALYKRNLSAATCRERFRHALLAPG